MIWARRMPITMVSWLMETSLPRRDAGDTSDIYIGDTDDASPMPNPPQILKNTNHVNDPDAPVPIADVVNRNAARKSELFLPNRLLNIPDDNDPTIQPSRALLITQPCISGISLI